MVRHSSSSPVLSRQERMDLWLSRALPRLSGRANRMVIRASRGRLGSRKRGIPIGLLTTTGRRSQRERTVPLMYLDHGDRFLIVASNAGYDRPPAWLLNLEANPAALFEPRGNRVAVRGRVVSADERTQLWPRLVEHNPLWNAFQSYTDRDNVVVALEPTSPAEGEV